MKMYKYKWQRGKTHDSRIPISDRKELERIVARVHALSYEPELDAMAMLDWARWQKWFAQMGCSDAKSYGLQIAVDGFDFDEAESNLIKLCTLRPRPFDRDRVVRLWLDEVAGCFILRKETHDVAAQLGLRDVTIHGGARFSIGPRQWKTCPNGWSYSDEPDDGAIVSYATGDYRVGD